MGRDKLWIDIFGRPAWRWSLDALLGLGELEAVAVVTPAGAADRYRDSLPSAAPGDAASSDTPSARAPRFLVTDGGASRADSVAAGLDALASAGLADETLVLVHDAARPAASTELIRRVVSAAEALNRPAGVVPAVPVHDSLRRVMSEDGESVVVETVDRASLVATQTPQLAPLGMLREALRVGASLAMELTDEAAALTAARQPVHVVPGDPENHKLTDAADERLVRAVLRARVAPVSAPPAVPAGGRAAVGFDAHRLVAGRPLRLGGVAFPDEPRGLEGHSDGDAALHAVIDALLGAAGAGDIGEAFPAEEQWRDADSAELTRLAADRVRAAGWEPASVDVVIVAAQPSVAPRRGEMEERIGGLVGLPVEAVTVRGTTSDGLGFTAAEGIAAHAVAVVRPGDGPATGA